MDTPTQTTEKPAPIEDTNRPHNMIEVTIPGNPSAHRGVYPVHVEAYLLYETIDVIEVLTLTIDPFKDDGEDEALKRRRRAAAHRVAARLEEALVANVEADDGAPCRVKVAHLDAMDARTAAREAERAVERTAAQALRAARVSRTAQERQRDTEGSDTSPTMSPAAPAADTARDDREAREARGA